MENREILAKLLAGVMCRTVVEMERSYIQRQQAKREEILETHKQQTGKYDRTVLEHALYKPNPELDDWLKELLIDAALEKNDRALFLELTTPMLEGW